MAGVNVYEPLDKALREINRHNLRAFGRLQTAKWDELNVVREVRAVWTESEKIVRKKLRRAAEDEFLLFLMLCGWDKTDAARAVPDVFGETWMQERGREIDPVTRYRFASEAERKEVRLIESLTVPDGRGLEIEKALKLWTRQIGWFGIYVADRAAMEAFQTAGVKHVMWNTEQDGRQCGECDDRHGQIYPIGEVPPKPHHGCRCWLTPVD